MCLFCQIVKQEIPADVVYQDEQLIVFKDIYPKTEIHLLIIPREHIENLGSAENHQNTVGYLFSQIPFIAKKLKIKDFKIISNSGAEADQVVFHLHVHLLAGKKIHSF